jgi:hypothetical protein
MLHYFMREKPNTVFARVGGEIMGRSFTLKNNCPDISTNMVKKLYKRNTSPNGCVMAGAIVLKARE